MEKESGKMRLIQTSFGLTNCEHITHIRIDERGGGWCITGSLLGKDHEFTVGTYKKYKEAEIILNKILNQRRTVYTRWCLVSVKFEWQNT